MSVARWSRASAKQTRTDGERGMDCGRSRGPDEEVSESISSLISMRSSGVVCIDVVDS